MAPGLTLFAFDSDFDPTGRSSARLLPTERYISVGILVQLARVLMIPLYRRMIVRVEFYVDCTNMGQKRARRETQNRSVNGRTSYFPRSFPCAAHSRRHGEERSGKILQVAGAGIGGEEGISIMASSG